MTIVLERAPNGGFIIYSGEFITSPGYMRTVLAAFGELPTALEWIRQYEAGKEAS